MFVNIELGSRRLVHFGVTRNPTDAWVAQRLREATPFSQGPRYLIRDNDRKYGRLFARVASGTGIEVLRTPYGAPKANAICERFLGSVRRECLDHFLILSERYLQRVMKEYGNTSTTRDPIRGLGRESHAGRCRGQGHRRANRSFLALYWVVCITITGGARLRDHHIPELLDGWEYSARTGTRSSPA